MNRHKEGLQLFCAIFLLFMVYGCGSTEPSRFLVDKVGSRLSADTSILRPFIAKVKTTPMKEQPFWSPIRCLSFPVRTPDTVTVLIHSVESNESVRLFRGFLEKGYYYFDFDELGFPPGNYFMKYHSFVDSATTKFWIYGK